MADLWEALKSKLGERLNWDTFKTEMGQGLETMPQAGLVLDSASMFPKFLRLAKELPFEERTAIAKAVPAYVKSIAGNKAYDFSGKEAFELLKKLAKLPGRYASNTRFLDRSAQKYGEVFNDIIMPPSQEWGNRARKMSGPMETAIRTATFGGRTGASNLYAGLIESLKGQGFTSPYREAKKLLEFAGYTGIK